MAEAAIAIVSAIGAEIGGAAGATMVMYAETIGTALFYTAAVASSYEYQKHQRDKARSAYNAGLTDRLVMRKTAAAVRSRCYGFMRNVDGVLFDESRGPYKKYRTLVVALAGHEVDAIDTVWFNDTAVELNNAGWVMSEPWAQFHNDGAFIEPLGPSQTTFPLPDDYVSGSFTVTYTIADVVYEGDAPVVDGVIDTSFGLGNGGRTLSPTTPYRRIVSYARVRKYLGSPSQDISPELHALFPDTIDVGEHRFSGIALLLVDLEVGKEDSRLQQVPNITATLRGAKVLDPRTSATAYSGNLALIARDWIYHANGGAMPAGLVPDAEVSAAADVCDLFMSHPVMRLYWGGIVCPTDQDPWAMLQEMAEGMAGDIGWSGGAIRMLAGQWRAPVMEITDEHLSGKESISLAPQLTIDQVYNTLSVRFADAGDLTFAERPLTVRHEDAITADGQVLTRQLEMRSVTRSERVNYIAQAQLNDARYERTLTLPLTHACLPLQRFDTVYVTLERYAMDLWEAKVVGTSWSRDGGRLVTLKATGADVWPALT